MLGFRYLADPVALNKWRYGAKAKGRAAPRTPPVGPLALTQFAQRVEIIGSYHYVVEYVD